MADVKSGDVVVPGEQLCVIEELLPSFGTYEKNGVVYAATSGAVEMDLKERIIKVLGHNGKAKLALPEQGDVLIGEVINVYDQRGEIQIAKRNGKDIPGALPGEIHISNVTRRYIKSLRDVIQIGDIVRAVAISTHTLPVELSLVGSDNGVIFGKCVKCGKALTLTTHNNLICLRCENRETRELADDYGQHFGLEARPDLAPRRRSYERRDGRRYSGGRSGGSRHRTDRRPSGRDRRR